MVARFIYRYPHQPWPQGRPRAKAAERGIGLDERVLRRLLSVTRRVGHEISNPENGFLIAPDDLFICGHVTTLRAFYELAVRKPGVVERPDHHCVYYTRGRLGVPRSRRSITSGLLYTRTPSRYPLPLGRSTASPLPVDLFALNSSRAC